MENSDEPVFRATLTIHQGVEKHQSDDTDVEMEQGDDVDVDMDGDNADGDGITSQGPSITLDWTWGRDRSIVAGFWAFLTRKIADQLPKRI